MTKQKESTNKHVLLTGASRGIGGAIARKLLDEGYQVTGLSRSRPFPDSFRNHEHFTGIHADLGDLTSLEKRLKPVLFDTRNPVEVLVNNAGIIPEHSFLLDDETWMEIFERTLTVNLRAPVLLSKWSLNFWQANKIRGILINISSRAAYRGETESFAGYAASKSGLVGFTKTAARAFGKDGICAYTIAPGFVDTDMARESAETYGMEYLTKDSALGEMAPPEEVAQLIANLASGNLRHMTGATLHINSGSYLI